MKKGGIINWIDDRSGLFSFLKKHLVDYKAPKNLSFLWNFGFLAGVTLIIMIISGIFLAMHYIPHTEYAFSSIERIMREVNYGWLIRLIHMNGASMFFIVIYIHMLRGMYYGSYKYPRELLWILGVLIFLLMIATAFMGYVLPWGQMSFWGVTVITNIFSAIPFFGESIVHWLWGGFSVANATLSRFFVLHYLFPMIIVAVVFLHLIALHKFGSNNPLGINLPDKEKVAFHPYYTRKDIMTLFIFIIIFGYIVFFAPDIFEEPENSIKANPMVTPEHIVPEWYFLYLYTILKSIPSKLGGVVAIFTSILALFLLPWLDKSPIKSARFRPHYKIAFWLFVFCMIVLTYVGSKPAEGVYILIGQMATAYYFIHFFIIIPLIGHIEPVSKLPNSISDYKKNKKHYKTKFFFIIILITGSQNLYGENKDLKKIQNGFQVYQNVCSQCHKLDYVYIRDLQKIGFDNNRIKDIIKDMVIEDGPDEEGKMFYRSLGLNDMWPAPYKNDIEAKIANNGALPPNLSTFIKTRKDGKEYIKKLLLGYKGGKQQENMQNNMYYNTAVKGNIIAMANPLYDGIVKYVDGSVPNVNQMAGDVAMFLDWTKEPYKIERNRLGIRFLFFMIILSFLMYVFLVRSNK